MTDYEPKNKKWWRESKKAELTLQGLRAQEALAEAEDVLADVVSLVREWRPVVLCRDCRYRLPDVCPGTFRGDTCGSPYGLRGELRADDFCPYGEAGAAE